MTEAGNRGNCGKGLRLNIRSGKSGIFIIGRGYLRLITVHQNGRPHVC
jgi:hypothetical protein